MAPVEMYIANKDNRQGLVDKSTLNPGEKLSTRFFPQAEVIVQCDEKDEHGKIRFLTQNPELIDVYLYKNDEDSNPRTLESGEQYRFTGMQRIEIHSNKFHDEIISLKHEKAVGVRINTISSLEAKSLLVAVNSEKDPIVVSSKVS